MDLLDNACVNVHAFIISHISVFVKDKHCSIIFTDGTVAGNPADLTVYKDTNVSHDYTYIGNGCPGGDGSITPCENRIVKTADDEDQKNGTYYHFQAATSGTGAAIATDNTDSPDTFCPLGWQLPYSGTGGDYYNQSKSWNYLFNKYSIVDDETSATKVKSYPFSYVYSGYYNWYTGRLYLQSNNGIYWSSTIVNSTDAYRLHTWSSGIRPANAGGKAQGFALRCVTRY